MDPLSEKFAVKGYLRTWLVDPKTDLMVPGSLREGENVITTTGRQYIVERCAFTVAGPAFTEERNDVVAYIGVGIGLSLEVPETDRLANAVPWAANTFLKQIDVPTHPTATSIRFATEFDLGEISYPGAPDPTIELTEVALYTNDAAIELDKADNPPVSYKTFEKVTKTDSFKLAVEWDWRL
tara:strand:- start:100 stop:645 length:546 start_codon:yes stop_codon:yes gene_type:complete